MPPSNKDPGRHARRAGVEMVNQNYRPHHSGGTIRPQVRRFGDSSKTLAFLDDQYGSPLGWICQGPAGWDGVRTGTAEAGRFRTALRAVRFVVGGANA